MRSRLLRITLPLFVYVLVLPAIALAGEYKVIRVIDGDTIVVQKGSIKLTIRLVGIDAPEISKKKHEPGQPFSQQSTKFLAKLTLNKSADIKSYGADRYGRILAEVFVDGRNVNLQMIKHGLAEVYRGTPAAGHNMEPYWQAEEEARKSVRGIWELREKYQSPRDSRKINIFKMQNVK